LGSVQQLDGLILQHYIHELELKPKYSAKTDLWALIYLFDFLELADIKNIASELRQERIKRTPFILKNFKDVNQDDIYKLEKVGIVNVNHLLEKSRTHIDRVKLSELSGVESESLLELIKLSDLSRVGAIKSIRARLYYDAGIQTPEDFLIWDPKELREMLVKWVEETQFDGIAPLPKEIEYAIMKAKELPSIIRY
ncbi:MAG: DUF4332 domain-containing protein, partial [Candidatus Kariarchaeaceae archaeon]